MFKPLTLNLITVREQVIRTLRVIYKGQTFGRQLHNYTCICRDNYWAGGSGIILVHKSRGLAPAFSD